MSSIVTAAKPRSAKRAWAAVSVWAILSSRESRVLIAGADAIAN
jgi:hypothetical protein